MELHAQPPDAFAAVLGAGRGSPDAPTEDPRDAQAPEQPPEPGEYSDAHGMSIVVRDIGYHRNGVGGEGFWVLRFDWSNSRWKESGKEFVAVVFSPGQTDEGYDDFGHYARGEFHSPRVAVLASEEFLPHNVGRNLNNCWRGDHFAPALYMALQAKQRPEPVPAPTGAPDPNHPLAQLLSPKTRAKRAANANPKAPRRAAAKKAASRR